MGKGVLTSPQTPTRLRASGLSLTERDLDILTTLTKCVRVLTIAQIARTWWMEAADPARAAQNRLRALSAADLLTVERAPAHPEIDLPGPVATWLPGQPEPNFGAVSYALQTRWSAHPVLTPCVSASKAAVNRFGGFASRPPRQVERTHDIHMAQVYLHYRTCYPELLRFWVFEEQIKSERKRSGAEASYGQKLPDAILRAPDGTKVVEFGGAYAKGKLQAFHTYCKENLYPYEIW